MSAKRISVGNSSAIAVSDWVHLVERLHGDDSEAAEELYGLFADGIRFFLRRQLGDQDLECRVDDCLATVVETIGRGHLTEPDRLPGFVRAVLLRQIAGIQEKDGGAPRQPAALDPAEVPNAKELLQGMSRRERESLTRFYVRNEPEQQVCEEMNLTAKQFRALKSRAKARCRKPVSAPRPRS